MKLKRPAAVLALAALLSTAVPAGAGEPAEAPEAREARWVDSTWDAVLAQAKAENKHVFIDFYTTWCGPCKRLDKVTYVDPKVVDFLNSTVPVKYDCEKGYGETLAKQFKVVAYPTMVLLDAQGREIDRHLGYLDPPEFLEVMEGYAKGIGTVAFYEKKIAENPNDIETLHTLGTKYTDAVRVDEAVAALEKVMELDPGDERGWRAESIYNLAEASFAAQRYDTSKKYFERVLKEYPDSDWYERALQRLARVEYELKNPDAAVALYQRYLDRHADDPSAMNAFAWFCSQRSIGLDQALPVAQKAADLSGRDPGILDTLAEVYFAMGNFDGALKIGKEALAKEPDDTYFQDQVKKYEAAKAEADSRAAR